MHTYLELIVGGHVQKGLRECPATAVAALPALEVTTPAARAPGLYLQASASWGHLHFAVSGCKA